MKGLMIHAALALGRVYNLLNTGIGSHPGGFPSYDESTRVLDHIETMNPLFVTRIPIGISYQCRTMWAYFATMSGLESPKETANMTSVMNFALIKTIGLEEMDLIKRCNTDVLNLDRRAQADFIWLVAHLKSASEHFDQIQKEPPAILDLLGQGSSDLVKQPPISRPWHSWAPPWSRALGADLPSIMRIKGMENKGLRTRAGQAIVGQSGRPSSLRSKAGEGVDEQRSDKSMWLHDVGLFKNDLRGRILITSLHHAREPASLTVGLTIFNSIIESLNVLMNEVSGRKVGRGWGQGGKPADKPRTSELDNAQNQTERSTLTENSASPASMPSLMAHRHLVYVPFVNPDGYRAIEETGNLMIRKNQRPTCTTKATNSTIILNGIDLNRNYDSAFSRDHTLCDAEEYEGEYPFSEPETRAIRRLSRLMEPHVALNFHSYGDIWTRPWNCCRNRGHDAKNTAIFQEIHQTLNIEHFGSAPELAQLNYTASGEADDWLMDQFGTISMSPEVGGEEFEFYPPASALQEINARNLQRALHVMSKAGIELNAQIVRQVCASEKESKSKADVGGAALSFFNSGLGETGDMLLFLSDLKADTNEYEEPDRFATFHWRGLLETTKQFPLTNMKSRSNTSAEDEIELALSKDYQICLRPKMQAIHEKTVGGGALNFSRALTDRLLSGCVCASLQMKSAPCSPGEIIMLPLHLDSRLPATHPCYARQELDLPTPMIPPVLAS